MRVEILSNAPPNYSIIQSYRKEYKDLEGFREDPDDARSDAAHNRSDLPDSVGDIFSESKLEMKVSLSEDILQKVTVEETDHENGSFSDDSK